MQRVLQSLFGSSIHSFCISITYYCVWTHTHISLLFIFSYISNICFDLASFPSRAMAMLCCVVLASGHNFEHNAVSYIVNILREEYDVRPTRCAYRVTRVYFIIIIFPIHDTDSVPKLLGNMCDKVGLHIILSRNENHLSLTPVPPLQSSNSDSFSGPLLFCKFFYVYMCVDISSLS